MGIKIVYLDLEGTIYPGRNQGFRPSNIAKAQEIVKHLDSKEIPVRFITGRPAAYVEAIGQMVLEPLMNGNSPQKDVYPSICEGGGELYYHFDKKVQALVQRDDIKRLKEFEYVLRNSFDGNFEAGKDTMTSINPRKMDIESFYNMILGMALKHGATIKDKCGEMLHGSEPVPGYFFEITHSNSAVDITIAGTNKGVGLEKTLELCSLEPEDVLVIGDSWNDKPGMEVAGHIGIVGNAGKEFKRWGLKKGAVIALNSDVYGVEEIIKQCESEGLM